MTEDRVSICRMLMIQVLGSNFLEIEGDNHQRNLWEMS